MRAQGADLLLSHPSPARAAIACSVVEAFLESDPAAVVTAVQAWAAGRHDPFGP